MNRFTKSTGILLLCFVLVNTLHSQDFKCGTSEYMQKIYDANPQMAADYEKEEARLVKADKEGFANGYRTSDRSAGTVYIVPVVFHILHQYGAENISDAQVKDAIKCMTNDFRKLNSDTINTVAAFKSIAADAEIEFRLAQKDPNGNCTNGIDRIYSSLTNNADDNSKLNSWNNTKYLNIWVVKTIGTTGVAGYATFPGGNSSTDGILILADYIGSIGTSSQVRSHTLSHEVGHYLNLRHVWGNGTIGTNCSTTNDNVSDTPVTKGHDNTCPTNDQICNSGIVENVQNIMEYSYCYTMFTAGQVTRMRTAITGTASSRNNLWSSGNLTATGVSTPVVLCKADFQSSQTSNTVCANNSLTFTDLSWNGTATVWDWSFPGGTPSTSTVAAPVIQYKTAGTYDVSLTVTNSSGTVSATKTAYVKVNPSLAMYTNTVYSEGFEGSAIPNTDWQINNQLPGANTWTQTSVAAATGSKCVRIVNNSSYDGYVDELISPSINMTAITGASPLLTFKMAHAQKVATPSPPTTPPPVGSADKLQVYVSTNCGISWTLRKTLTGAQLATAGVNSGWTTPLATEWMQQSVIMSGYVTYTNLFVMFRFTSNAGNNIYIDDINISGAVGIEDNIANSISLNVYPNPADENTLISFDLTDRQKVKISIMDVLGREVSSVFDGNLDTGEHQYPVADKTKLKAGIYFVKLEVGRHSFTKKLIVE